MPPASGQTVVLRDLDELSSYLTNAVMVIVGLFIGVAGAVLMMWPTLTLTDQEITDRTTFRSNLTEPDYFKRERAFARLGGAVALVGAFIQSTGALIF